MMEKQENKQENKQEFKVSPFGHVILEESKIPLPASHGLITQYGVVPDKAGGTDVTTDNKISIFDLVQSYKDDCGVEAMLKLIKSGQSDIKDFAWDGKTGAVDVTGFPQYVGDLKKLSESKTAEVAQMSRRLNITIPKDASPEQLTELIGNAFANLTAQIISQSKPEVKDDTK